MKYAILLVVFLPLIGKTETATNAPNATAVATSSNAVVKTSASAKEVEKIEDEALKDKTKGACHCQGVVSGGVLFFYFFCLIAGVGGLGWLLVGIEKRVRSVGDAVADGAVTAKTILRHTNGVDDIVASVEQKLNASNERLFNAIKSLVVQELATKKPAQPVNIPAPQVRNPEKVVVQAASPFAECVRSQFPELLDDIVSWSDRKLRGVEVITSSLHVLTTMPLVDDETWLMALRNVSIGLSYVSESLNENAEANVSRLVKWSKALSVLAKTSNQFSLSVPSIGSKVDYSWMTPIVEKSKTDVSSVRSWAVYTAFGVRHNAEVA